MKGRTADTNVVFIGEDSDCDIQLSDLAQVTTWTTMMMFFF